MTRLRVRDLVGENCITLEDGNALFLQIHPVLSRGGDFEVDFAGVEVYASPFLNAAFGRLLEDIDAAQLNDHLRLEGMSTTGVELLNRVIANAKSYYGDPAQRTAVDSVLSRQSEE